MGHKNEMTIIEKKDGSESVCLYVQGSLDVRSSTLLRDTLNRYFSGSWKRIQVALDDVSSIDSSGVATLVEGLKWSRKNGRHFILSGLNQNVYDLLVMSKLDGEFEILPEGTT